MTKKKPVKKTTHSFKPLLKQIVKFLNEAGPESRELWDVLTALRGPDNNREIDKNAATAVIRHAVGLKGYTRDYSFVVLPDSVQSAEQRQVLEREIVDSHFRRHAQLAFEALELKWDEVN